MSVRYSSTSGGDVRLFENTVDTRQSTASPDGVMLMIADAMEHASMKARLIVEDGRKIFISVIVQDLGDRGEPLPITIGSPS